ncbi:hypothetical protein [Paracoccus benzoatiresistens]|uniref:Uncharacterized protein n=1 Tax=Paracoccus benzoatiresistens TaxID=2997341 RepID=A0ABT4J7P6_9RHOB|nr:hypothetical protein [Paracoccus sp. EF6]MCZ0963106.1 hypothetical protein [Paracoccus sp. EF6]
MPRDRIRTTREDATGFEDGVKGRRKEPILKPLDQSALATFAKRKRVAEAAQEPPVAPTDQSQPPGDHAGNDADGEARGAQGSGVPPGADEAGSRPEPKDGALASGLSDLVVPPRTRSADTLQLTLRLRVLNRHVPAMNALAEKGIKPDKVLRKAYRRLGTIRFEPRYVPRVEEPSGPVGWNHRLTVAVKKETLQAIEAQVRDGASAPRSHLLLGQIERTWFASLEDTMKELSE